MLLESDVPRVMILFLLLILPLFLAACDRETAPSGQAEPAKARKSQPKPALGWKAQSGLKAELSYHFAGRAAPDASFTGADGREVALSDYAGRPLLVNLWATWCAPCKAEMPTLDALAATGRRPDYRDCRVAGSARDESRCAPFSIRRESSISNPLPTPTMRCHRRLAAIALPTTILYDSQGKEVWRVVGGVEWDDAEIARLLDEAA
jgi:thiol-disulfide isomerase/thioredoxin